MTKDRIARCLVCNSVDWVNREVLCEFCAPTAEWLPGAGFVVAATPHVADETKNEAA